MTPSDLDPQDATSQLLPAAPQNNVATVQRASCPLWRQQHVEQYMKCKHTWNLLTPEHSNGGPPLPPGW